MSPPCPGCRTLLHRECWGELRSCPTLGCGVVPLPLPTIAPTLPRRLPWPEGWVLYAWLLFLGGGALVLCALAVSGPKTTVRDPQPEPSQAAALADGAALLEQGQEEVVRWRALTDPTGPWSETAAGCWRSALTTLEVGLRSVQSATDPADWRGWSTPRRAMTLFAEIEPLVAELEAAEWRQVEAARAEGRAPPGALPGLAELSARVTDGPLWGRLDLGTSLEDLEHELGIPAGLGRDPDGILPWHPSLLEPETLGHALAARGVWVALRGEAVKAFQLDYDEHWRAPFEGQVWGAIGRSSTRSDVIALLGWPIGLLQPKVTHGVGAPSSLVYVRGGRSVSFGFEAGFLRAVRVESLAR